MRIWLIGLCLLSACEMPEIPWPVQGRFDDGLQFQGVAIPKSTTTGTLRIVASDGLRCSGDYTYFSTSKGAGDVACADGQRGNFTMIAAGTSGTFEGTLNGRRFTGYF